MVWMAGDNNLEENGNLDLKELMKIGSTDDVNVVVQFDRMSDDQTRRFFVKKGELVEQGGLGETNTGDPAVAADFFTWGVSEYPANRIACIFWNHGSGIDETDVYRILRSAGTRITRGQVHAASDNLRRSLFAASVIPAAVNRGIAYDDTARDFLDNIELRNVLDTVHRKTGRTVDVLGFDACLMNMIEVAAELREFADYMVGSEETEPVNGWPYDSILKKLIARPSMQASELSAIIVEDYVKSYSSDAVTQSALNLARTTTTAKAVDELATALIAILSDGNEYMALTKAIRSAQRYDTRDFVDLVDLCDQIAARVSTVAVRNAASKVVSAVTEAAPLVSAEKHRGTSMAKSHGVTIYLPWANDASLVYERLEFSRNTRWGKFIKKYHKD